MEGALAPHEDHHADWLPHGDRRHLAAAFVLLLVAREHTSVDSLHQRLDELQIARGRIERADVDALLADLSASGHLEAVDGLRITHAGSALLAEWAGIMRDRRRLARSFLRIYDDAG
jgi:hypothetical protein